MEITVNRIYMFPNGTRIDLEKIIGISAIEKDAANVIHIKVFCTGFNKPIEYVLGYAIGIVSPESKAKIERTYSDFIGEWEAYIREKQGDG